MASDYRRGFAARLRPYAQSLEKQTGIPSTYTLALAASESGWDDTSPTLFGLRGTSSTGQSITRTNMIPRGIDLLAPETTDYASYATPEEAFQHLGQILSLTKPRVGTAREFAEDLQRQGLKAPDPSFADHFEDLSATLASFDIPEPGDLRALGPLGGPGGKFSSTPPQSPTQLALARIEAEELSHIQGREHLSDPYKSLQAATSKRALTAELSYQETSQQLAALKQPDEQDYLASFHQGSVVQAASDLMGFKPPVAAKLQYSPEKQAKILAGQTALDLAAKEQSKARFMSYFLEAAPAGYRTGDFPADFSGALDTFLTQVSSNSPNPQQYKEQILGSLSQTDTTMLQAAWAELPATIPRTMTDDEAHTFNQLLQTKPRSRPVSINALTNDELLKSLTGTAPSPIPDTLQLPRYYEWMARQSGDPELVKNMNSLSVQWKSMATEWYKQNEARKLRTAGALNADIAATSGWDWIALGAQQPSLLAIEAFESFQRNISDPYFGTLLRTGTAPAATTIGGALVGAGFAGPPGALIGAGIGLASGLVVTDRAQGEVSLRYAEIRRQQPGVSDWRAAEMAYNQAELGLGYRLLLEGFGDPTNIFGSGLPTKAVKMVTTPKWFGAYERGLVKFLDVSTYPIATGFIAGTMTGSPALGLAAGIISPWVGARIPRTFTQMAKTASVEATRTWETLATRRAAESTGVVTALPRAEDLLDVARRAVATVRRDPDNPVQTELHSLGRFLWHAGFKPVDVATDTLPHANLSRLAESLSVVLPPTGSRQLDLMTHEITDVLYGNLGPGVFYKRPEMASRIAAMLGTDLNTPIQGPKGATTAGKVITQWLKNYEKGTFAEALKPFTRRPTDGTALPQANPTRALQAFTYQYEANQLSTFRHPGYQIAHAGGIAGSMQRFYDKTARLPAMLLLHKMTQNAALQNLLYVTFGPMNVVENGQRMFLGGVHPFPGVPGANWYSTSLDVVHLVNLTSRDLDNKRAVFGVLSDHFRNNTPLTAVMPDNPGQVLQGLRTRGYGSNEGVIPGVTRSIPDTLRSTQATSGMANWFEAHIPRAFHSLRNMNELWNAVTRKQEAYYLYNKWIQGMAEIHPEGFKRLLGTVGDINDSPLRTILDQDVRRALQQKINTYALTGDPELVRALTMSQGDLLNTNLANSATRVLAKYPQLGEPHQRAVLHAIQTGQLQWSPDPHQLATNVREFTERLRLSWWDQAHAGKLEFASQQVGQIQQQLLGFHPTNADELGKMVGLMSNLLDTAEQSATHVMDATAHRGDDLGPEARGNLFTYTYNSLARLVDGLSDTYAKATARILEQINNPALGLSDVQKELYTRRIKLQAEDLLSITEARKAEEARHIAYQAAVGNERSRVYLEQRQLVRDAWDRHHTRHADILAEAQEIDHRLQQSLGVPVQTIGITMPNSGVLMPEDVARLYNSLPAALISGIVDPVNLTLQPKATFVKRHLAVADRKARALGQSAEEFGFTEANLGEVYDNLLRSVSLDPQGTVTTRMVKPGGDEAWIRSAHGTPRTYGEIDPTTMRPGLYGEGFYTTEAPFIGRPEVTQGYSGLSEDRLRELQRDLTAYRTRRDHLESILGPEPEEWLENGDLNPQWEAWDSANEELRIARNQVQSMESELDNYGNQAQTRSIDIPADLKFYDVRGGATPDTYTAKLSDEEVQLNNRLDKLLVDQDNLREMDPSTMSPENTQRWVERDQGLATEIQQIRDQLTKIAPPAEDFTAPIPEGLLDQAEADIPGFRASFDNYVADIEDQISRGVLNPGDQGNLVLPNRQLNMAEAFYRHLDQQITHSRDITSIIRRAELTSDIAKYREYIDLMDRGIETHPSGSTLEDDAYQRVRQDPEARVDLQSMEAELAAMPQETQASTANEWLAQQGFEGITHIGGVGADAGPHTVRIIFPGSLNRVRNSFTNWERRPVQSAPTDAASTAWFKSLGDELTGAMTISGLHPDASTHLNEFVTRAADNLQALRDSPDWDHGSWQQARAGAMDRANTEYHRDFPNYDDQNMFDAVMKSIYPFWIYEKERFPWLISTMIRRPAVGYLWSKYMENTDEGYIGLPGSNMQINPLRGGVAMGGFRRLMLRDTPEYYDQFPEAVTSTIDRASRLGFYPGIHVTAPLAMLGGTNMQSGEILPPWTNTFLGAINNLPIPDYARRVINDQIFPDRYREFRVIQEVGDQTQDPDLGTRIYAKLQGRVPLTPEETATWNRAEQRVWLIAGTLDSQVGMFRMRGKDKVATYNAMKEARAALIGVPVEEVDRIQKMQSTTGKRVSDVYPMDPLQQWVLNEYLDKYTGYMRPQTAPLMPSALGRQQVLIQSYYDEVDKIHSRLRTEGFYEKDNAGNQQLTAKSLNQLEQEFRDGKINPDEYRTGVANSLERANTSISAIGSTGQYAAVPKTRAERERFYTEHGILVPTWSAGQELTWEYYNIRPEMRPDEDGTLRYDFDTYFTKINTLMDAMTPEIRQRFLARVQAEWTDTQRLYWQHSKQYLAPYRNIRNVAVAALPPEQQQITRRFLTADAAEKQRLRDESDPQGKKIIGQVDRSITQMRANLRQADPDLDATLLFWGKTDKVLTREAATRYNQMIARYRPGAQPIAPPS